MKQLWITKAGGPEVFVERETPDPIPKNGEVRVRVSAAGVNFADVLGRMGMYPDAPPLPFVPGYEISGTVDLVGQGVTQFNPGDRVFGLTKFGGYSSVVCVPHKQLFSAYDWLSDQDAAALPVNYLTAYMLLKVLGSVRPGDWVLIHNASGGVGLAALDLCKIVGAKTIGTASLAKHEFLLNRGLHFAVDYRHPDQDYERVVQEITNGKGVHLILDPLGGPHWYKNYRLLRPTGRLLCFGASNAAQSTRRSWLNILQSFWRIPRYSPLQLMNDNKGVLGFNIGRLWDEPELVRGCMEEILSLYDEFQFRPHIGKQFAFNQVIEAHKYLQSRDNIGKILLIP